MTSRLRSTKASSHASSAAGTSQHASTPSPSSPPATGQSGSDGLEAGVARRRRAREGALADAGVEAQAAAAGARQPHAAAPGRRARGRPAPRRSGVGRAAVQVQVEDRVEAARDGQQVALEAPRRALVVPERRDVDRLHAAVAVRGRDALAEQHLDADGARGRAHLVVDGHAGVDDRRHLDAGRGELERRAVPGVGGREDDRALRHDGQARGVGPGGAGQHHAGAVVAGEDDRPLGAPVASTSWRARTCQTRRRGSPAGSLRRARPSATRSTSSTALPS